MLEIEKVAKVANNYYCEKCDYTCSKLYNWNKHLDTAKHIQETNGNDLVAKSSKIEQKYCCENVKNIFTLTLDYGNIIRNVLLILIMLCMPIMLIN